MLVCINLMLGKASVLRSIFLGAALAVLTGFSNYLGYFTLIFMFLYVGTKLALVDRHLRKGIIAGYFLAFSVFISLLGVFLLPYVKSIIGEASLGAIGGQSRSLGDFVIFTSRPWYYFLPSVDNPFFGNLSQKAIDWLQNDWGYWLTANYFKSEHSASYLGLVNFLFALLGGIYILRGVTKQKGLWTKEKEISVLGIVGILIFFLTWPPFFTVSLHKIYTPSYLLWKIAPMFRSLARLGILILLIELVFTGTGYLVFVDFIKRKFKTPFAEVFVLLFFVICLVEFYIPIKLNYIGDTPEVFSYIEQNTPNDTALVIYPYEKIEDAVFWLPFYQRYLVNHMNAELTESLPTPEGVLRAKDLGSDYILYFPKADEKNLGEFFEQTPLLQKVAKFSYTGEDVVYYKFMKVQKRGDFASFSSILYKIK